MSEVNTTEAVDQKVAHEFTNDLFRDKDHYLSFKARWGELVTSGELRPSRGELLVYNLLRQTKLDKGFTRPTNKNKLDNGYMPHNWGFTHAKVEAWAICRGGPRQRRLLQLFEGSITKEMLIEAGKRL